MSGVRFSRPNYGCVANAPDDMHILHSDENTGIRSGRQVSLIPTDRSGHRPIIRLRSRSLQRNVVRRPVIDTPSPLNLPPVHHRMNRSHLPFLLVVLLLPGLAGRGTAFAQTPLPASGVQSADVSIPPTATQGPLPPPLAKQASPTADGAADTCSYWIVGTRHCVQRARYLSDTDCPFDFYHVGPDGQGHPADRVTFRHSLRADVPICIAVHGSFASWESVQAGSRNMNHWIRAAAPKRPLQVIFFDWPSDRPLSLLPQIDIGILGLRSGLNGIYLARLIKSLPNGTPLSLIGHSHGARTVSAALHLLGGGTVQGHQWTSSSGINRRIHVVLAAAAIDHQWLDPGGKYGRVLSTVESILNLRNRRDIALSVYPLRRPFSRRALARRGWSRLDHRRLGKFADRLRELDVTDLVGHGHFWCHYHAHPEIARAIAPDVFFANLPDAQFAGPSPEHPPADAAHRPSSARRKRIDLNLMRSARRLGRPGIISGQHGGLGDVY